MAIQYWLLIYANANCGCYLDTEEDRAELWRYAEYIVARWPVGDRLHIWPIEDSEAQTASEIMEERQAE